MKQLLRSLSLVVTACLCIALTTANAQVITASIRGKVTDAKGAVLPNAKITARQTETNLTKTVTSGSLGEFYLASLPAGHYEVTAEAAGFATKTAKLELNVGKEAGLEFAMEVGSVSTVVEVSDQLVLIEPTKAEIGETIRKDQVDNLPTVNRDFSSLALLVPGVSTGVGGNGDSLAINGQRGYQNNIFVDGVSNQWQYYGRQASTFSQDWIQEFEVKTNSYSAEFGSASGGVLNVITRSGTNNWHGRGYVFYRRKEFDATPFAGTFANNDVNHPEFLSSSQVPDYSQRRWGGFVGGPIVKDRLFIFAGYEDLNRDSSDSLAISDYWRQRGFKTVLPTSTTDHPFIIKGDYNVTFKNHFSTRFDRTIQKKINEGDAFTVDQGRDNFGGVVWNVVANLTTTVSNSSFNEFRFGYMSNWPPIICNQSGTGGFGNLQKGPPGTFSRQEYPTFHTGCPIFTGTEGEQNMKLSDSFGFIKGHHQVKFGADFRRNTMDDNITNFHDGYWAFEQDLAFDINDATSYPFFFIGNSGPGKFTIPIWNYGFFVQDTWQVRDGLTLNLGLRYEVDRSQTAGNQYVDAKNASVITSFGGAAPLVKTKVDYNNVAPRVGFIWTPTASRKTKIHAAAGLFYDQNHGNFNAIYIINTLLSNGLMVLNAFDPASNPFWDGTQTGIDQLKSVFAANFPFFPVLPPVSGPTQGLDTLDPGLQVPYTVTNLNPTGAFFPPRPEPKNSRDRDSEKNVDLRITKTFKFKDRLQASVFWEMYNTFNAVNFTSYDDLLESTTFGLPIAAQERRRQQLGFRIDF